MARNNIKYPISSGNYPDGVSYRVYADKVTECTLAGAHNSFNEFINNILKDSPFVWYGELMAYAYKGFAHCNTKDGDTFDEKTGQKIARERCMDLYHQDFDAMIIKFLEELHTVEARLFNRLRKAGKINVYLDAMDVDEIYDKSFIMDGQKDFAQLIVEYMLDHGDFPGNFKRFISGEDSDVDNEDSNA